MNHLIPDTIDAPESREKPAVSFEDIYLPLRKKEHRVYTDREVALLPDINQQHPHYKEWQLRKQSSDRLAHFLENKQPAHGVPGTGSRGLDLRILEIGCGNGWLSHRLAMIANSKVTGLDINFAELQQAVRVFEKTPNLQFIFGDINKGLFPGMYFDIVVFAASIQYFPSFTGIINITSQLLKPGGEIHILDSHFYKPGRLEEAKKRTTEYYHRIGFPEMAHHYFHHCSSELDGLNYRILYQPPVWTKFFPGNSNPFNWICITK